MTAWRRRIERLRRLLGPRMSLAVVLVVLMLVGAVIESFGLSLVVPLIAGMVGAGTPSGTLGTYVHTITSWLPADNAMAWLLALLAVVFFFKALLLLGVRGLTDYFSLLLRDDWSVPILFHYLESPQAALIRARQGTLLHNVTVEPFRAGRGFALVADFVNRVVIAAVLLAVLLVTDWRATLVVAVMGVVLFYGVRRSTFRFSVKSGRKVQELSQEISAIAAELLSAATEIKLFNAYDRVRATVTDRLRGHTRAETLFLLLKEIPVVSTEFVLVLVLMIVVALTQGAGSSASALASLGLFLVVGQRLLSNVSMIVTQRMKIAQFLPSLLLVDELLQGAQQREVIDVGKRMGTLDGDIVFRGVRFSYEGGREVLAGLNLTIARGRTTALIGPSGIGKSTIADLLLGLGRPDAGEILIGSHRLSDLRLDSLRQAVGYVSQHPVVLNASVAENIRFGRPDATDEQVREAARRAHADEFIRGLPQGYDTIIGDRGASLSGGERQRIAIARVIVRGAQIYVFDEATSALDSESEALVRDSIRDLAHDATILVIAHRMTVIESADTVYRLAGGTAVAVTLAEARAG